MKKTVKIVRVSDNKDWVENIKRAFPDLDLSKPENTNVTAGICDFISTFARFENVEQSVPFYLLKKQIRNIGDADTIIVDESDVACFTDAANKALKTLDQIPATSEGKLQLPLSTIDFDKLNAVVFEFKAAETVRD